ncbi:MAG: DUF6141 family protein [Atribacterota bacterium]
MIAYHEVQRFKQVWFWSLILVAPIMVWFGMIRQLVWGRPFGNHPLSDTGMLIFGLALGIGFPLFFLSSSLTTEVRSEGIFYRYFPFHLSFKSFPYSEITHLEVITFHPLRDFGGWGLKLGRLGMSYTVYGNQGVRFVLRSGKVIVIGSQKPREFHQAVTQILGINI